MNYFEVQITLDKPDDGGTMKKTKENYIVDALSFTEAESRSIAYITPYAQGEMEVTAIKRSPYSEIINRTGAGEHYYQIKLMIITVDEQSGKEHKSPLYYLVNAMSVDDADAIMREEMKKSMLDWSIEKVAETKILDIIDHA